MLTARQLVAYLFLSQIFQVILMCLLILFLFLLLRVLTRHQFLAASIFLLLWTLPNIIAEPGHWMINLLTATLTGILVLVVMLRSGLLALAIGFFVFIPVGVSTSDFSAWYGGTSLTLLAAVLALAIYAFHASLGGQKLFAGKVLEE